MHLFLFLIQVLTTSEIKSTQFLILTTLQEDKHGWLKNYTNAHHVRKLEEKVNEFRVNCFPTSLIHRDNIPFIKFVEEILIKLLDWLYTDVDLFYGLPDNFKETRHTIADAIMNSSYVRVAVVSPTHREIFIWLCHMVENSIVTLMLNTMNEICGLYKIETEALLEFLVHSKIKDSDIGLSIKSSAENSEFVELYNNLLNTISCDMDFNFFFEDNYIDILNCKLIYSLTYYPKGNVGIILDICVDIVFLDYVSDYLMNTGEPLYYEHLIIFIEKKIQLMNIRIENTKLEINKNLKETIISKPNVEVFIRNSPACFNEIYWNLFMQVSGAERAIELDSKDCFENIRERLDLLQYYTINLLKIIFNGSLDSTEFTGNRGQSKLNDWTQKYINNPLLG